MEQNKVSIILPTYNGSKHIGQSIESCLNQTYFNIELIIVDDASIDDTPSIITSFKDGRIRVIRHETNKGLPSALNTGFKSSAGNYLTWTSDDNYYASNAIEKMASAISDGGLDFVYCDFYALIGNDDLNPKVYRTEYPFDPDKNTGIGACFMYKREVMEAVGDYDAEAFLAEDYDYWIRVSKKFKMTHIDEPLYFYRKHQSSLFESRFYEVRIVATIVKVKNGILDIPRLAALLIDQCIYHKYAASVRSDEFLNRIFVRYRKEIAKFALKETITALLTEFKLHKRSFEETKRKIDSILMPYITGQKQ